MRLTWLVLGVVVAAGAVAFINTDEADPQHPAAKPEGKGPALNRAKGADAPAAANLELTEDQVEAENRARKLLKQIEVARAEGGKNLARLVDQLKRTAWDTPSARRYAYGVHNNLPEGPAYPVRTISDGSYRYIRNLTPNEIYIERHLMGVQGDGKLNNPYWQSWIGEASVNADTYALAKRYMRRPAEQLYHTADDPYEMHNRIDDPSLADKRAELGAALDRWLVQQGDPGQPQDSIESLEAARRGEHRFVPPTEQP